MARALAAGLSIFLLAGTAGAADVDPHALFEDRCSGCHGHAGSFARERLQIADGELMRGAAGSPVAPFLAGHMGGQSPDEVAALVDMMTRQLSSHALFEERCRICHDRAHELARLELIVEDGVLRGRYTDRDIADFLLHHGRSTPEEAALLTEMLRWQRDVLP